MALDTATNTPAIDLSKLPAAKAALKAAIDAELITAGLKAILKEMVDYL